MDRRSIETISLELAILARRLTSMTTYHKDSNLDRAAYLLLHQICTHGSAGVKALADEFNLNVSTVSRQSAALEQKGYVCRVPDPIDKRAFSLQITEAGHLELRKYEQQRLLRIEQRLQDWSDEEREMFGALLEKFNRTFSIQG